MNDIRDDEDIKTLVYTFYDKVRVDERLGYIFNDFAQVNWDEHLPKMVDFWSNLLFRTGRYRGRPFREHIPLPIQKTDFAIWYGLFEQTVNELFSGEKAEDAKNYARNIAASFNYRFEIDGKYAEQPTDTE